MEELTDIVSAQTKELAGQLQVSPNGCTHTSLAQVASVFCVCSQGGYHHLLEAESEVFAADVGRAQALHLCT